MHATTDAATDDGSTSITIPLRSRRVQRAQLLLPLRDAVAALALAWASLPRFRSGVPGEMALAAADAIVAVALVVAIAREYSLRGAPHGEQQHHGTIAWTEVAAALMLFVEAYHQWHEGRPGRKLPYLTALVGLITLYKGMRHDWFAARTARRRVLRLDGEGMLFRWSRLHRVRVPRSEIASLAVSDRAVVVTRPDGTHRTISLRDALEPARVVAAVRTWAEAEGIAVDGVAKP